MPPPSFNRRWHLYFVSRTVPQSFLLLFCPSSLRSGCICLSSCWCARGLLALRPSPAGRLLQSAWWYWCGAASAPFCAAAPPDWRFCAPNMICRGAMLFAEILYASSIFLISTVFLCPKTQNMAYLFRDIPCFENCPLGYNPIALGFF